MSAHRKSRKPISAAGRHHGKFYTRGIIYKYISWKKLSTSLTCPWGIQLTPYLCTTQSWTHRITPWREYWWWSGEWYVGQRWFAVYTFSLAGTECISGNVREGHVMCVPLALWIRFSFLHACKRKRSRAQKEHIFSLSNCVFVRAPYVDVNGYAVALVSPAQIVIKPP